MRRIELVFTPQVIKDIIIASKLRTPISWINLPHEKLIPADFEYVISAKLTDANKEGMRYLEMGIAVNGKHINVFQDINDYLPEQKTSESGLICTPAARNGKLHIEVLNYGYEVSESLAGQVPTYKVKDGKNFASEMRELDGKFTSNTTNAYGDTKELSPCDKRVLDDANRSRMMSVPRLRIVYPPDVLRKIFVAMPETCRYGVWIKAEGWRDQMSWVNVITVDRCEGTTLPSFLLLTVLFKDNYTPYSTDVLSLTIPTGFILPIDRKSCRVSKIEAVNGEVVIETVGYGIPTKAGSAPPTYVVGIKNCRERESVDIVSEFDALTELLKTYDAYATPTEILKYGGLRETYNRHGGEEVDISSKSDLVLTSDDTQA